MSSNYLHLRRFDSLLSLVAEIIDNVLSLELEWFMIACCNLEIMVPPKSLCAQRG